MKKLIVLFMFTFIGGAALSQSRVSERIRIAKDFINCIKTANHPNETIVKKFVVTRHYFKDDSVKKIADYYINGVRESLNGRFGGKKYPVSSTEFLKYSEHEKEFQVTGVNEIGETPRPRDLIFSLASQGPKTSPVNKDDLFAVRFKFNTEHKEEEGTFYILFDEDNKIVSFAGMQIGYNVTLMQF